MALFSRSNPQDQSTWISGISNGTFFLLLFIAGLVALWIYYSKRQRRTNIHPDNQQDVQLIRQRSEDSHHGHASAHSGRSQQDTCPICLAEPSVYTVQTNCGHLFCGNCIINYWKFQSNWMSGMKCPVCRQQVTVLLKSFTPDEQSNRGDNVDRQTVVNGVKDFNRRFSGAPRTYREYFQDIPVLIPHILRQIFSVEGLNWTQRIRIYLIILATILYVISPLDILPEGLVGFFGLLDDFLVMVYGALQMIIVYRNSLARG